MNIKGKTALVTGASSGIGWEFSKLLAARGVNLVIAARRKERLEALASELRSSNNVDVTVIPIDLSVPEAANKLYEQTEDANQPIDILINNAGFGTQGLFHQIPWKKTADQLQLNIVALTQLTRLFMTKMIERKHGYILNVASIGAYIPSPYYATYTAGKSYVRNFTEAAAYDARGTGVRLCCLCPGPTESEFLEAAGHTEVPAIGKIIFMSSSRCARIGLDALFRGRVNIISGWMNKLMMLSLRLVPRWVMVRISATFMGPIGKNHAKQNKYQG